MNTRTFPVTGPLRLVVRIGYGSVDVVARDDLGEARVELEAIGGDASVVDQTVVEQRGGVLVVHGPRQGGVFELPIFGGRRSDQSLAVRVVVPSGTPAKISTVTAPVTTDGRLGACDVAFGAADVTLDEVAGDLRLRFGSGTARAGHVHGAVALRSGAGDATFDEIGGDLRCGCGRGALQVGVAHGRVHARTGSGAAHLDAVHGDVDLLSGSGAMSIGLPAGVSARLDVASGAGTVRSELPVEEAPATTGRSITVRARTGSGDVRLFRAA